MLTLEVDGGRNTEVARDVFGTDPAEIVEKARAQTFTRLRRQAPAHDKRFNLLGSDSPPLAA